MDDAQYVAITGMLLPRSVGHAFTIDREGASSPSGHRVGACCEVLRGAVSRPRQEGRSFDRSVEATSALRAARHRVGL